MKKIFNSILILLMVFVLLSATVLYSGAKTVFELDGYSFSILSASSVSISGWDNRSDNLVIPKMLNNRFVTEIEDASFKDNSVITALDLTPAVLLEKIGYYAFNGCVNLAGTIRITGRTTEIGDSAFEGCSSLEEVQFLNANVRRIPAQCFYNCTSLSKVELEDTISTIEKYAFANCINLHAITIPASVTTISSTAFINDKDLTIYCYTDSYAQQFAEENGIDYVLLDAPAKEYFIGNSLSLNGDIGVNFYLDLTEDEASGAVVNFSWNVNDDVKTATVNLSGATRLAGGYKATCRVAPAEMTGDIHAQLLINGEKVGEDTYSAKQYADVILSDSFEASYQGTGARSYDNLRALVLNMLSFGSRAQTAFKVNQNTLADKDSGYTPEPVSANEITVTETDMTKGLDAYGLQYVGSTLVCLTETTIRHYYKVTDQAKFDAVKKNIFIGSKPASPVTKDGTIYFEISNIAAADLDRNYTLKIGNNAYRYSALHYIKTALPSDKVEDDVKELIQVLYRYNQAANAYFAK